MDQTLLLLITFTIALGCVCVCCPSIFQDDVFIKYRHYTIAGTHFLTGKKHHDLSPCMNTVKMMRYVWLK